MSELSNKDLDRLFREGSEQYDPMEVKPEAWQQMEALLDRQRRRRFLWWLLGILVFLTGLGTGLRHYRQQPAEVRTTPIQAAGQKDNHQETEAPTLSKLSIQPPVAATKPQDPPKENTAAPAGMQKRRSYNPAGPLPVIPQSIAGAGAVAAASQEGGLPSAQQSDTTGGQPLPAITPMVILPVYTLPLAAFYVTMDLPRRELLAQPGALPIPPPAESLPNNALVIGFNGAAESSAAPGSAPGPIHLRGGITAELRYGRHFSISTGLFLSNKKYSAGEGAYTPPKGFWTYKIAPTSTRAECTVLEVPLNVGYFLRHHSASTFFFEAGLSNFFMLEEHYWYDYADPTPGLIRYWAAENENRHYLSILNLAPGYQWQVRPWVGLQISPYAQIPLGGVGHGKVALSSFGLNLRVNFTTLQW